MVALTRMSVNPPMLVLHRFTTPGHWAEIRERKVTQFRAIEFLIYVDGAIESQMFHNGREAEYPAALQIVSSDFANTVGSKHLAPTRVQRSSLAVQPSKQPTVALQLARKL